MKTVILMRHSHASSENPAFSDHDRPLTPSGKQLAEATAKVLAKHARPDRILCSTATRTQETAEILVQHFEAPPVPEAIESLYFSPAGEYLRLAAKELKEEDETVLFVGHNPGIANLIYSCLLYTSPSPRD